MGQIKAIRLGTGILYVEMDEVETDPVEFTVPQNPEAETSDYQDTPEGAKRVGFQKNIQESVASLRSSIQALASDVAEAFEKAAPDEWSLEFNIGFKGKATPIPVLLGGEAESALKITATWRKGDSQ